MRVLLHHLLELLLLKKQLLLLLRVRQRWSRLRRPTCRVCPLSQHAGVTRETSRECVIEFAEGQQAIQG